MMPEMTERPMPEFTLPKDVTTEKSIGENLVIYADYEIIERNEMSAKVSLKNLRIENKRRLNV